MINSTMQDEQDDLIIIDDSDDLLVESEFDSKKNEEDSWIIKLDNTKSAELIDFNDILDDNNKLSGNIEQNKDIIIDKDNFDDITLSFWDEIKSSDKISSDKNKTIDTEINNNIVFDLDKATELFITQLNKRKEQIADFIKKDESSISDLEEQIKRLQQEVKDFNLNIKKLNEEDNKINDRISILTWTVKKSK